MITCAREGCEVKTHKKTHNQKYCSDECCRLATNKKIMDKYYARRDQRRGKARWCEVCGVTKLSRYNDSLVCSSCQEQKALQNKQSVLSMLSSAQFAS